jgi:hypothetical protein
MSSADPVRLHRTPSDPTPDQALWVAIRNGTRALSFDRYQDFINRGLDRDEHEPGTDLHGAPAYHVLRNLTEAFLVLECGVRKHFGETARGLGNEPCLIELIWSYWMEEGMLVQTMNGIAQRFQNVRTEEPDALQNL